MNDFDLLHVIAHEISHAIDPCNLEVDFNNKKMNVEGISNSKKVTPVFYDKLVPCLVGGHKSDSCQKSILHCNSKEGIDAYCKIVAQNTNSGFDDQERQELFQECLQTVVNYPNCSFGDEDPSFNMMDLSDYKKGKYLQSQVSESFADFMASEVVGQMTLNKDYSTPQSIGDKIDSLVALTSVLARLHGRCLEGNTNDPHPPSHLRINRVVMSSKKFRDSLCGTNSKPPQKANANVTL